MIEIQMETLKKKKELTQEERDLLFEWANFERSYYKHYQKSSDIQVNNGDVIRYKTKRGVFKIILGMFGEGKEGMDITFLPNHKKDGVVLPKVSLRENNDSVISKVSVNKNLLEKTYKTKFLFEDYQI